MTQDIQTKHANATDDTETVIVLCGSRGGHGYVVSDTTTTVAEAVESARGYGGTAKTKGYTAYEFGPGITYVGHDPMGGIRWEWGSQGGAVTITERTKDGRVKSTHVMTRPSDHI